jgi:hypothetical protein
MRSNADGDIIEASGDCLTSAADVIGTDELDDGTSTAGVNKIVKVDSASTAQFEYSDCTITDAGAIDCPAPATAGGSLTIKEGQDDGSNTYSISVPDSGLTATKDCEVTATGLIPDDCLNDYVRSMYWPAGSLSSDGTNCTDPAEVTLNSGPKLYTISCADNAASIVYGSVVMPDAWDAGTVTFEITAWHGTTETITFAGDFSAQCRAAGEVPSSTWGTAVAADVSITTANQIEMATTAAVTAAGTCAAGDALFWRWVMDATTCPANCANTDIVGVKMEYSSGASD